MLKAPRVSARWSTILAVLVVVVLAAGAYAWRAGYAPRLLGASVAEDKLATAPRLSIVVLPFENLSGDKEQDYFADGDHRRSDNRSLRICPTASSSPVVRPSRTRASLSTLKTSAASSACDICSKAACAASGRRSRSTLSLSRPIAAPMSGPTGSTATKKSIWANCKWGSFPA